MAPVVVLYDGVCGFCDRTVRFVLRHDSAAAFRFATLQSPYAAAALERHGRDASDLDTVALLIDPAGPAERVLVKSDAIVAILRRLGGIWRLAALLEWLPRGWRDAAYDAFASRRYRWFGQFDECPIPSPELRARLASASADDEGAPERSTA